MVAARDCYGTLGSFFSVVIKDAHTPILPAAKSHGLSPPSSHFSRNHSGKKLRELPGSEWEGWGWECWERGGGVVSLR